MTNSVTIIKPRQPFTLIRSDSRVRINAGSQGLAGVPGTTGLPFKPSVGRFLSSSPNSTSLTTATASVADVAHLIPLLIGYDCQVDQIQVNVATAIALAEGKLGLFRSNTSGRPSRLIEEVAAPVSFAAAGLKTATLSAPVPLARGELVWASVRHSLAGVVLSAPQLYSTLSIDGGTGVTTYSKLVRQTGVTYSAAMPSTWTWSDADLVATGVPIIGLRIAA